MKFFVWLIRVLVFVLLLVLALANTQSATLNFLAGYFWQAPLILIGLAFFVVGLAAGLLSSLPSLFRLRMEMPGSNANCARRAMSPSCRWNRLCRR
jgi:putative membrane protein